MIHMQTYEFLIYLNIISAYLGTIELLQINMKERIVFKLSLNVIFSIDHQNIKVKQMPALIPFAFCCCY